MGFFYFPTYLYRSKNSNVYPIRITSAIMSLIYYHIRTFNENNSKKYTYRLKTCFPSPSSRI